MTKNFKKFNLLLALLLSGCFVTATLQKEPPMVVRDGKAPKAAFITYSDDKDVASFAQEKLKTCLETRNVFKFVDSKKVAAAIKKAGIDTNKIYGLSNDDYKKLAESLKVDYVFFGNLGVVKALKLTGWRKDIYSLFYLYDNQKGDKVNSWRSDTTMTTTDAASELDALKMSESVINHTCAKIIEDF
ncbi:MAG: hypothetical protein AB7U85_05855 [Alphaproteobacteria bacterium]